MYRARLSVYTARLTVHRALLSVFRALLSVYKALLGVSRVIHMPYTPTVTPCLVPACCIYIGIFWVYIGLF